MEFVAMCPEHTAEASVPLHFRLLAHPSAVLETELRFVLTFSTLNMQKMNLFKFYKLSCECGFYPHLRDR